MKSMGVLGEVWGVLRKPRTNQFPVPGLKRGSGEWKGKNADTVVSRPATLAGLEKCQHFVPLRFAAFLACQQPNAA